MYERIATYELEMDIKRKAEQEAIRIILEKRKEPIPIPPKFLITQVIFKDREVLVFVEDHMPLTIKSGCVNYDANIWSESEAIEYSQRALALVEMLTNGIHRQKRVRIKNVRRNKVGGIKQLAWNC